MWWILLILLTILMAPFIWALYTPLILHIETNKQLYFMEARPILRVSFYDQEKGWGVWVTVLPFRWQFQVYPTDHKKVKKAKTAETKREKRWRPKRHKLRNAIAKAWREFFQSFHIKRFALNLDTDDYILNAQLFPLFVVLDNTSSAKYDWQINFQGQNSLTLVVQNRLSRLTWIAIKTFFRII